METGKISLLLAEVPEWQGTEKKFCASKAQVAPGSEAGLAYHAMLQKYRESLKIGGLGLTDSISVETYVF